MSCLCVTQVIHPLVCPGVAHTCNAQLYGRGHDTRSFNEGIWRVINVLTFNFYLHAEHHLSPSVPIPQYNPELHTPQPEPELQEADSVD